MTMHLDLFIFLLAAITVVVSSPLNLFSSTDTLSSSEGFSSSLNLPSDSETSFLDDSNSYDDDDLFIDFTTVDPTMDFTSNLDDYLQSSPFESLLASCFPTNEQPASKVRSRDQVCTPSDNQPLLPSIDGFIDNALGIFGDPSAREEQLQEAATATAGFTKINSAPVCSDPEHPVHLCCEYEGRETDMVLRNAPLEAYDMIFETMENCGPGT